MRFLSCSSSLHPFVLYYVDVNSLGLDSGHFKRVPSQWEESNRRKQGFEESRLECVGGYGCAGTMIPDRYWDATDRSNDPIVSIVDEEVALRSRLRLFPFLVSSLVERDEHRELIPLLVLLPHRDHIWTSTLSADLPYYHNLQFDLAARNVRFYRNATRSAPHQLIEILWLRQSQLFDVDGTSCTCDLRDQRRLERKSTMER